MGALSTTLLENNSKSKPEKVVLEGEIVGDDVIGDYERPKGSTFGRMVTGAIALGLITSAQAASLLPNGFDVSEVVADITTVFGGLILLAVTTLGGRYILRVMR